MTKGSWRDGRSTSQGYFREVSRKRSTRDDSGPDPTQEEESIGIEEVVEAIGKLKGGKAPGICGNDAEMLKAGGPVAAEWLHRVIELAWAKGKVVEDWNKAVIVPLHKKAVT